jgi:hypothetical protein
LRAFFHEIVLSAVGDRLGRGYSHVPKWRNGRRGGLKIRGPQGRVSSNLTFGTSTRGASMTAFGIFAIITAVVLVAAAIGLIVWYIRN